MEEHNSQEKTGIVFSGYYQQADCAYCGEPVKGISTVIGAHWDEHGNVIWPGTSYHNGCLSRKRFEDEVRDRLSKIEEALGIKSNPSPQHLPGIDETTPKGSMAPYWLNEQRQDGV